VKDAFADAGLPVVRADVKTTPEGRSRGFAIVEMADSGAAERAVDEMNQRELGGRSINVRRFNSEPRE
jgi:RNA recognition motif-containing protein